VASAANLKSPCFRRRPKPCVERRSIGVFK
jgi:hypothetical protein